MIPRTENEAIIRKYRILHANRLGFYVYAESLKMGRDLDPERIANNKLASALESAGVPVRYMSGDDAFQRAEGDLNFTVTHFFLPVGQGTVAVVDASGNETIPTAFLADYGGIETRGLSDEINMDELVSIWSELQTAQYENEVFREASTLQAVEKFDHPIRNLVRDSQEPANEDVDKREVQRD